MTKRVALFLPSLIGGGAERSAVFVAKTLERAGYMVDLVVAEVKGALAADPYVRAHLVDLRAGSALLALRPYRRYLRESRPDLVISFIHSANFMSGLAGQFAPRVPFVVSVRNSLEKRFWDQWWIRRWFGFGPERWLYRRATLVQTITAELEHQIQHRFRVPPQRLWLTHNTASDPGETPRPLSQETLAVIAAHRPFLVSAARLAPVKGFPLLIGAYARARLDPALKLVILGDGPERPRLEALIAELRLEGRVVLAGYQDPITPWLEAAQGFVFASRAEGFGRVVLEALTARLPVVASDAPGIRDVLGHGRYGRLVGMDDAAGFAQAMEDIAAGRLTATPEPALAAYLQRYTPEAVGAEYVAMIEHCIGGPEGPGA